MIYPEKLEPGMEVRIVAPARSLSIMSLQNRRIADGRFADLGLRLSFGKHVEEVDDFSSSSIESRIEDLHDAFSNKNVRAVITVIGGFNSNQLLKYLDWDLIKNNPKIFCGYSDITVLNDAILAKTGLVNYYGPHYSTFGQKLYFDYTLEYFKKCLFSDDPFEIKVSSKWSDDSWFEDQDNRILEDNQGTIVINEGRAKGTVVGGNINTFNLLQGTEFFPEINDSLLFIEDDAGTNPVTFDRDLQSLIHLPDFGKVKGILIGRFQKASGLTKELLAKIVKTKKELNDIPVVSGIDFGHTDPKITFPIGGEAEIIAGEREATITILKH